MTKKSRRKFTIEQKKKAVDDYVSGRNSAAQVAAHLGVDPQMIYRWRVQFDEQAKDERINELESEGHTRSQAKRIQQLEDEVAEYQKKVAELTIANDLLKKLRMSRNYQPESELTGLIATTRKLDQKRRRVK